MKTLYQFTWNHKTYVSTNGMELLRFADWLGSGNPLTTSPFSYPVPQITRL